MAEIRTTATPAADTTAAEPDGPGSNVPALALLGIEIVSRAPNRSRLKLPHRHEITQPHGIIQGGILATLADAAVAQALVATLPAGTGFTTIELKINYVRPAESGTVWADAELLHVGRRTCLGEVTLTDDDGKLIAKSTMTYMLFRPEE